MKAVPKAPGKQERLSFPPLQDLPLNTPDELPFLRPGKRTRVRRPRRSLVARLAQLVTLLGASVAALFGLFAGYKRVMASERLRVSRVEVGGAHFLSEGEVRELMGPAVGRNILTLDLEALQKRLRSSPWVADAVVRRSLPDTLQVEVRERRPLALAEMDRLFLMDSEGTLIDIYGPRTAGFDLPIVRGLRELELPVRRERAERAGALLQDLGELESEVSEVIVEPAGDLRMVLKGEGEVLLVGPPYKSRLETFLSLRKELGERCPRAQYFDLRFRDRIYAMPAADPGSVKTAPAAVRGG
jgi:cell division septal protein FtsQ